MLWYRCARWLVQDETKEVSALAQEPKPVKTELDYIAAAVRPFSLTTDAIRPLGNASAFQPF